MIEFTKSNTLKIITSCCLIFTLMLLAATNSAWAQSTFGSHGRNGENGPQGQAGSPGRDVQVEMRGNQVSYTLNGTRGGHGGLGRDGGDAYDCDQPLRTDYDLQGATGGQGGRGGHGGDGGKGGDVTVFFDDQNALRNLLVFSVGGEGGEGGSSGRGGRGCNCSNSQWSVKRCDDKKNSDGSTRQECGYNNYSCRNGSGGSNGIRGSQGKRGADGALYLVKSVNDWQANLLKQTVSLDQAVNSTYTLVENNFEPRTGATRLLATGSIVDDEYFEYISTETVSYRLNWRSDRHVENFRDVTLKLDKNGNQVLHTFEGALLAYDEQGEQDKVVTVNDIVLDQEAEAVKFEAFLDGPNSRLKLIDSSGATGRLKDVVELTYYTKTMFGWKKRLTKELSDSELRRTENGYEIAVNGLGLKKKFFKKNRRIKVKIKLTRSLGNDDLSVDFTEKLKLVLNK